MGERDLTLGSDLDMVAVYDAPPEVTHSDGPKPLWASTYFNRLMQRLQTAITAQTGEGRLFEIDLRLRPSGKDGPLAIHIDGFERYQKEDAWTWEHMALVRSRVAVGPPELAARLDAVRMEVLAQPRSGLREAVRDMRAKMAAGRKAGEPFDLKHRPGGLIDLEFLAQYLVLNHAAAHPPIAERSAAAVFHAGAGGRAGERSRILGRAGRDGGAARGPAGAFPPVRRGPAGAHAGAGPPGGGTMRLSGFRGRLRADRAGRRSDAPVLRASSGMLTGTLERCAPCPFLSCPAPMSSCPDLFRASPSAASAGRPHGYPERVRV